MAIPTQPAVISPRPPKRFPPPPPLPPSPPHSRCPPPSQTASPPPSQCPHTFPRHSCTGRSRACAPTPHTPRPLPPRLAHTPPCAASRPRPSRRASPRFPPARLPPRSPAPRRSTTLHRRMGTALPPMRARCLDGRTCARSERISLRDTRPTRRRPCWARRPSARPRSWPRTGSSASARRAGGYSCLTLSRLSSASAEIPHQVLANALLHFIPKLLSADRPIFFQKSPSAR